jgi:hypothetical protein
MKRYLIFYNDSFFHYNTCHLRAKNGKHAKSKFIKNCTRHKEPVPEIYEIYKLIHD